MRHLPPFAAIRAFESAARHLSLKLAAEELCVTPSAISHQIRTLEDYLGTTLFVRKNNRLGLTLTGSNYVGKLTSLLDSIETSTKEACRVKQGKLRVLTTPGFAARWLAPRLNSLPFNRDISLSILDGAPNMDFSSNDADVVISWFCTPSPGITVEQLFSSVRYPVVSPEFKASNKINKPSDLLQLTLFQDDVADDWVEGWVDGWIDWFKAANVDVQELPQGPKFTSCELGSTAAEFSQGVTLAYDAIIQSTLDSGRLVRLFDVTTHSEVIYSVAYKTDRGEEKRIRAFLDWLSSEARAQKLVEPIALAAHA